MAVSSTLEMLRQEIASLPERLAEEVFDFVLFVKARRAEEAFLWEQVEATRAYRRDHPEEIITASADEWEADSEPRDR